ncbi:MAG: nuclear transport factor 2 family protein [Steroidobacteraceae bacterium]
MKNASGFLGALVLTFSATAAHAAVLTTMDYIEIQQLVNRLNFALDYCENGGRDFAALFTDDGQYVVDEGDGKSRVFRGVEQLAGLAGGPDCATTRVPPRSNLAHLAESLVIEPSDSGATGKAYAIYPSRKGKVFQPDVTGQVGLYHDEYAKTSKGWRLKSRRHEVSPR